MDHTLEIKMKRESFCTVLPMVDLQCHIPGLLHLLVSNALHFVVHLGGNLMKSTNWDLEGDFQKIHDSRIDF